MTERQTIRHVCGPGVLGLVLVALAVGVLEWTRNPLPGLPLILAGGWLVGVSVRREERARRATARPR